MGGALRILSSWLTPVVWLSVPALMLTSGPGGLWVGLVVALAPLLALHLTERRGAPASERPVQDVVLALMAGLLVWANLTLAGEIMAESGGPRWHGVIIVLGGMVALGLWREAGRLVPGLFLVTLIALGISLPALIQVARAGPVTAWGRLATRAAFQFPPSSPWVTEGRTLPGRLPIAFDEEHRITAPAGGVLRVADRDGGRVTTREWKLEPGQSITLRPGDLLDPDRGVAVRLEAGRRVPGAPASGAVWAAGRGAGWPGRLAVGLTLVGGAIALAGAGGAPATRLTIGLTGAGLVLWFLWAQGWAVYGALQAPEVFLGGVIATRLTEVPVLALAPRAAGRSLQGLLIAGLLAGCIGSALALRERIITRKPAGRAVACEMAFWAIVAVGAAVASLTSVDPWTVTVWALGAAASAVAPVALVPAARARPAAAVGVLATAGFLLLTGIGALRGTAADGPWRAGAVILDHPAVVIAPAALALLWLAGRRHA